MVIAEDEPDIRSNLSLLLGMEGFTVFAAPNGEEALALVRAHQPDIVLSDVMMPRMTGHQLVRALRSDPATAHTPVVLLTAKADRVDVREGMNLGADDYLTKPFQRDELLTCIQAQLEKAALQHIASRRAVEQAHHLLHYDKVTDLPNRAHFLLLLQDALSIAPDTGEEITLLAIGLDNLAQIAQVLGAGPVDECLGLLAQRLTTLTQAEPLVSAGRCSIARLGDDRLAVLTPRWPAALAHREIAAHLLAGMSLPVRVAGEEHFPTISVAICNQLQTGERAEVVLARLDLALAAARAQTGPRIALHDASATPDQTSTFRLHNDLHRAVDRGELAAFFQPQVTAQGAAIKGFEALMRWRHPTLGLVSPAKFIPLAEDNGQIVRMGAWMLQEACQQAVRWQATHTTPLRVAVNLSLRQFGDPHLARHVQQALDSTGLPPEQLELEITEGTAMLDMQHTLNLLRQFKAMGLKLAIDDFGTGYSSLAYLKRFPLDVLKIDQSFVRQICTDRDDRVIAGAIISLAHSLGLSVIAEGVETAEQHALLEEMGCEEIQGYLHGKPMPAEEVAGWLSSRTT
ncbi:REC domain-containing phosphodiesterase [Rhodoferax saidenbachensis]|uniref:REC domain-containing phosphodiesterase n=1 Tax=Rhodoferax saidenbachensis TaxID=1484693 RepID=A0A1P8KFA8_9BURK|nr:REC domain-containing phosphodiesterase [Rhodoferax saidenbachensis]